MKILIRIVLFICVVLLIASPTARLWLDNALSSDSTFYTLAVLAVVAFFLLCFSKEVQAYRAGTSSGSELSIHILQTVVISAGLMWMVNELSHCAG